MRSTAAAWAAATLLCCMLWRQVAACTPRPATTLYAPATTINATFPFIVNFATDYGVSADNCNGALYTCLLGASAAGRIEAGSLVKLDSRNYLFYATLDAPPGNMSVLLRDDPCDPASVPGFVAVSVVSVSPPTVSSLKVEKSASLPDSTFTLLANFSEPVRALAVKDVTVGYTAVQSIAAVSSTSLRLTMEVSEMGQVATVELKTYQDLAGNRGQVAAKAEYRLPAPLPMWTTVSTALGIAVGSSLATSAAACTASLMFLNGASAIPCAAAIVRAGGHLQIAAFSSTLAAGLPPAYSNVAGLASWTRGRFLPPLLTRWADSLADYASTEVSSTVAATAALDAHLVTHLVPTSGYTILYTNSTVASRISSLALAGEPYNVNSTVASKRQQRIDAWRGLASNLIVAVAVLLLGGLGHVAELASTTGDARLAAGMPIYLTYPKLILFAAILGYPSMMYSLVQLYSVEEQYAWIAVVFLVFLLMFGGLLYFYLFHVAMLTINKTIVRPDNWDELMKKAAEEKEAAAAAAKKQKEESDKAKAEERAAKKAAGPTSKVGKFLAAINPFKKKPKPEPSANNGMAPNGMWGGGMMPGVMPVIMPMPMPMMPMPMGMPSSGAPPGMVPSPGAPPGMAGGSGSPGAPDQAASTSPGAAGQMQSGPFMPGQTMMPGMMPMPVMMPMLMPMPMMMPPSGTQPPGMQAPADGAQASASPFNPAPGAMPGAVVSPQASPRPAQPASPQQQQTAPDAVIIGRVSRRQSVAGKLHPAPVAEGLEETSRYVSGLGALGEGARARDPGRRRARGPIAEGQEDSERDRKAKVVLKRLRKEREHSRINVEGAPPGDEYLDDYGDEVLMMEGGAGVGAGPGAASQKKKSSIPIDDPFFTPPPVAGPGYGRFGAAGAGAGAPRPGAKAAAQESKLAAIQEGRSKAPASAGRDSAPGISSRPDTAMHQLAAAAIGTPGGGGMGGRAGLFMAPLTKVVEFYRFSPDNFCTKIERAVWMAKFGFLVEEVLGTETQEQISRMKLPILAANPINFLHISLLAGVMGAFANVKPSWVQLTSVVGLKLLYLAYLAFAAPFTSLLTYFSEVTLGITELLIFFTAMIKASDLGGQPWASLACTYMVLALILGVGALESYRTSVLIRACRAQRTERVDDAPLGSAV